MEPWHGIEGPLGARLKGAGGSGPGRKAGRSWAEWRDYHQPLQMKYCFFQKKLPVCCHLYQ